MLANDAALADVTGADIWNINSVESVAFEYSRHNNNVTDFYAPDVFRASDHNPEIVGIDVRGRRAGADGDVGDGSAVPVRPRRPGPGAGRLHRPGHRHGGGPARHTLLGSAAVAADGSATVQLPPRSLPVGNHQLTVSYSGDEANEPSSTTVQARVDKARPRMTTDVNPNRVTTRTPVSLEVALSAPGITVSGPVTVQYRGITQRRQLSGGDVEFNLGRFPQARSYTVRVSYAGNNTTESVTEFVTIRVQRP